MSGRNGQSWEMESRPSGALERFHFYKCNLFMGLNVMLSSATPSLPRSMVLLKCPFDKFQMETGLFLLLLFASRADGSWCDAGFFFPPPHCEEQLVELPNTKCANDSLAHPRFAHLHFYFISYCIVDTPPSGFSCLARQALASQAWGTHCWALILGVNKLNSL